MPERAIIFDTTEGIPAVTSALNQLGLDLTGKRVLIKPNLHQAADYRTGSVSNPHLVEGVIHWAKAAGARAVVIGESGYFGNEDPEACFTETGIAAACKRQGVRWVPFEHWNHRRVRGSDFGKLPEELLVTEWFWWADFHITVGVMKTHLDCGLTLSAKNLKGFLHGTGKMGLHKLDLDRGVASLPKLLPTELTIMDASPGMDGMGPAAGDPVPLDLAVASPSWLLSDGLAAELMQVDLATINTYKPWLKTLSEVRSSAEVIGVELLARGRRFRLPHEALFERFQGVEFRSKGACSGCLMRLMQALQAVEAEDAEGLRRELAKRGLAFALGAPDESADLAIGNCAKTEGRPCAEGCPPKAGAVVARLKELLSC